MSPAFSIHSFWVGVTPACKLGTETKNWTCDESPSEQGLPPHTKAVCRQNIASVAFSNGDLEKTGPANSKVISWRKSERRIRKALQKRANIEARNVMIKMQVHEDIGAKRTAAIFTCAGWVLDRRQVGKNLFCTYKTPSCVKLLEIKLVGYVYFWIKWARLFNPLILSRSDPAETQSLIWRMSGGRYSTVRLSTYYSN